MRKSGIMEVRNLKMAPYGTRWLHMEVSLVKMLPYGSVWLHIFFMEVGITVAVAFLMENLAPPPTDPDLNFLFSSLRLKIPFNPQENLGYIAAHKFGPVLAI